MKKTILPIMLILLVCFVYASALSAEITIKQGWNIIAGTIPQDGILADSEIKLEDIEAMWYYSPLQKKYIRVYPDTDWTSLQKDDDDFVLTSAMWIYSKKNGIIRYSTLEDYPQLNNRKLYSGWNFVTITPNFKDYSLNQLKGSCNILKIYSYQNNQWKNLFSDVINENKQFGMMSSMRGIVIKVSNDCNLGLTGSAASSPPPLPS